MCHDPDQSTPKSNYFFLEPRPPLQKISLKSIHNFLSNLAVPILLKMD